LLIVLFGIWFNQNSFSEIVRFSKDAGLSTLRHL